VAKLYGGENFQRQRCCSSRNISRHEYRRSKFANGAGKRQDDSSNDATRSKWKRDWVVVQFQVRINFKPAIVRTLARLM
jgi:hypothetical protein